MGMESIMRLMLYDFLKLFIVAMRLEPKEYTRQRWRVGGFLLMS